MANRRFIRPPFRSRGMLLVVALIVLSTELTMRGMFAKEYYYLSAKNLQLRALAAVKIGAEYLPENPHAAIRAADAYAVSQGIAPAEIIFTEVSLDNTRLKINFDRKIPGYVAVLAMGGLPGRDINVTASAWRQDAKPIGTPDI